MEFMANPGKNTAAILLALAFLWACDSDPKPDAPMVPVPVVKPKPPPKPTLPTFEYDGKTRWVSHLGDSGEWLEDSNWKPEPQGIPRATGIYEVSYYARGSQASPEQLQAQQELYEASLAVAKKKGWFEYEKALADGFIHMEHADPYHYSNNAFIQDDDLMNPERPEFLLFHDTPRGKRLTGIMFLARTALEKGPQVGGPDTIWHYHIMYQYICYIDGKLKDGHLIAPFARHEEVCPEDGVLSHRSPEMMHVWFVDHPLGRFATPMTLPIEIIEKLAREDAHPGS